MDGSGFGTMREGMGGIKSISESCQRSQDTGTVFIKKKQCTHLALAGIAVTLGTLGEVHIAALGTVPVTRLLGDTHVHAVGATPATSTLQ